VRTSGPPRLDTNGRLVAVGGEVWRTGGGEPLPGLGEVLLLSPDGTVALVFRDGGFVVVETASGKTVAALRDAEPLGEERDYIPEEGSFSPDGQRVLTSWGSTARLWDATTGEPIAVLGRPDDEIGAFAFGDGGRLVLATFSDRAAEFSAADGTLRSSVAGSFGRGDISSNGAFAAAPLTGGAVDVADIATGARVILQTGTGISLASVSFGPTADVIVARDAAGDVHVVRCEICASDDELLALAHSRLAVLARIEAKRPPVVATA
jgi:WD40 repeat protein